VDGERNRGAPPGLLEVELGSRKREEWISGERGRWRGAVGPILQPEFGLMEMEEWRSYTWAGAAPAWYTSSVSAAKLLVCVSRGMLL
jgi:hypothetical protein